MRNNIQSLGIQPQAPDNLKGVLWALLATALFAIVAAMVEVLPIDPLISTTAMQKIG